MPLNLETLQIIFPYALTMAIVGLLASFLTAALVDDFTDTPSDKKPGSKRAGYCQYRYRIFLAGWLAAA